MRTIFNRLLLLFLWVGSAASFTLASDSAKLQRYSLVRTPISTTKCGMIPPSAQSDLSVIVSQSTFVLANAAETIKSVFVGVGVIVALLYGTAVLFSSVLIPKAAEQLENQAREIDIELWEEYEAKLGPNEVLSMRPELMQELGEKVRTKMVQKFEEAERRQNAQTSTKEASASKDSQSPGVIEAEIVSKERKED